MMSARFTEQQLTAVLREALRDMVRPAGCRTNISFKNLRET